LTVVAILAAIASSAIFSGNVGASSTRTTRGNAEAVLQAFGNGGWAILLHNQAAEGGPADEDRTVAIRPFAFFARHYCALDWHTILVADIEGGDKSFKHQQAEAIISQMRVSLVVDGALLQLTQTVVKRFLNPQLFGLQVAYYSQWGRIMAPSDLAVGAHTLRGVATDPSGSTVFFDTTITFFIDADGTGTCL
jgi:hypothetical protein